MESLDDRARMEALYHQQAIAQQQTQGWGMAAFFPQPQPGPAPVIHAGSPQVTIAVILGVGFLGLAGSLGFALYSHLNSTREQALRQSKEQITQLRQERDRANDRLAQAQTQLTSAQKNLTASCQAQQAALAQVQQSLTAPQ